MPGYSRRSFLSTAATIPFALWLETTGKAFAQPSAPLVRYEAYSTTGQAMLRKYDAAVGTMKSSYGPANPGSWVFHWYIHAVRPDTTKAAAIANYLANGANPVDMALAQETWDTCQAHHPGQVENFFLPWHRMYVYFFEQEIRYLSGDPNFTLPYWNYSAADRTHQILPPAFKNGSLFQGNRSPGVNQDQPINQIPGPRVNPLKDLGLEILKKSTYSQSGADGGFNSGLDFGLHGNVHTLIGDLTNMGKIEWAAQDPVFWVHHCNIDRIWASWNRNGGLNPTNQPSWMNQQFVFPDQNGRRVVGTIRDFLDIGALNYTYDAFEPAPPGFAPSPLPSGQTRIPRSPSTPEAENVGLGTGEVRVTLQPQSPQPRNAFAATVRTLTAGRKMYLVLDKLQANAQPGVIYDVYLNLPPGTPPAKRATYWAGSINFFSVSAHAGREAADPDKFRSFDVTNLLTTQRAAGTLPDNPEVSIIPSGTPSSTAQPIVGEILLIQQ
jgi:tyrosinase